MRFTRFSTTPETVTSRTPLMPENSALATSAKIFSSSSLLPVSDETPSTMIGTVSNEPLSTRAEAWSGRFTEASAAFSFSVTLAVLVPYSNSTRTREMLLREVVVEETKPSRARTAVSIGWLTCLSMTSGDAPMKVVTIAACGVSMLGISSCLSEPRETKPKTAIMAVIRATTERLARLSLAKRCTKFLRLG